jgi:hypothetical protein
MLLGPAVSFSRIDRAQGNLPVPFRIRNARAYVGGSPAPCTFRVLEQSAASDSGCGVMRYTETAAMLRRAGGSEQPNCRSTLRTARSINRLRRPAVFPGDVPLCLSCGAACASDPTAERSRRTPDRQKRRVFPRGRRGPRISQTVQIDRLQGRPLCSGGRRVWRLRGHRRARRGDPSSRRRVARKKSGLLFSSRRRMRTQG